MLFKIGVTIFGFVIGIAFGKFLRNLPKANYTAKALAGFISAPLSAGVIQLINSDLDATGLYFIGFGVGFILHWITAYFMLKSTHEQQPPGLRTTSETDTTGTAAKPSSSSGGIETLIESDHSDDQGTPMI